MEYWLEWARGPAFVFAFAFMVLGLVRHLAPPLVIGMGGLMTGIYWIIERRMKLAVQATPRPVSEEEKGNEP